MAKYRAVKEKHHHPDIGTYTAWGVKGWQASDRKKPSSHTSLMSFSAKRMQSVLHPYVPS